MKKTTLLLFITLSVIICKAQLQISNNRDSISLYGNMWKGIKYSYQDSKNVDIRRIKKTLNIDNENAKLIKKAESAKLVSRVLAVAGGICLGFSVTSFIADGKINVPIVATGGSLIAISLPLNYISIKKMKEAVTRYNIKK